MLKNSSRWLMVCLALVGAILIAPAPALAQAEPTINQVYEAAQAGKLDAAQTMIQQVLILRPTSAKAHFVQAELFARQGLREKASEALATAEKLAPGLPFAKPGAVQALRGQLAPKVGGSAGDSAGGPTANAPSAKQSFGMDTPATATSSIPPGLLLALGAGVIGLVVWLIRRKPAQTFSPAAAAMPANVGNGLAGPQSFGTQSFGSGQTPVNGQFSQPMQAGFNQPGQPGQAGYGQQPAGMGMGGRVMGGLAAGLAVGAGVMAAQAIGKNLMGDNANKNENGASNNAGNSFEPLAGNTDLGGQNFGMNEGSSWDDAGSADVGGGDWDS